MRAVGLEQLRLLGEEKRQNSNESVPIQPGGIHILAL